MDAHDHQALARKASERMDKQGVRARDCLPASEVERAQRIRDRFMKKNMPFEADARRRKKRIGCLSFRLLPRRGRVLIMGPSSSTPEGYWTTRTKPRATSTSASA